MYGQKFVRKLVKPPRIEKNRNGLDNARRLRGIYFIDHDDEEHKETLKNARRKLERPMAPAMPCKESPKGTTKMVAKRENASQKKSKTVCG